MVEPVIQKYEAKLDFLHEMVAFVRRQAEEAGFDETSLMRMELVAEEVLVNIISYGYPNRVGGESIEIHCWAEPGVFRISYSDYGIAFNPLTDSHEAGPEASIDERRIGGLGVFLMEQLMDELHYERTNGCNILKMTKNNL